MGKRGMIYPFCIGITPFERIERSQREQLNSGYIKIVGRGDLVRSLQLSKLYNTQKLKSCC